MAAYIQNGKYIKESPNSDKYRSKTEARNESRGEIFCGMKLFFCLVVWSAEGDKNP